VNKSVSLHLEASVSVPGDAQFSSRVLQLLGEGFLAYAAKRGLTVK
jgi:hypothetical protein